MKNRLIFVFCLALPAFFNAQNAIDANFSYATFLDQNGKPFIEVYLHVLGRTTGLKPLQNGKSQALLDVVLLFKQGEDVVKFDKYRLSGPVVAEPTDFVDVKRYALPNGDYQLEASVEDVTHAGNAAKYESNFSIDFKPDELAISDIELLASVKDLVTW